MRLSNTDNAARGYTITRTYEAPRERVWRAFTEPAQFKRWFGPADSHLENVEMDVREGGEWKATTVLANGYEIHFHGNYLELTEPERLVMTVSDQPTLTDFEVLTVVLTARGNATELEMRQSGGHLTDEQYEQARQGSSGFLDRLAELLAS